MGTIDPSNAGVIFESFIDQVDNIMFYALFIFYAAGGMGIFASASEKSAEINSLFRRKQPIRVPEKKTINPVKNIREIICLK